MSSSRNIKILLIVLSLVLLPIKGFSWWLIPGKYYAQLNVTVMPNGAGIVYVEGESDEDEGSNVKYTDTGYGNVTFNVEATVNGGYTFQGWSNNESGSPLLSTNQNYTTGNCQTSGIASTNRETNASQHYIFAIYSVIPYTLQLLPGDHGRGTQKNLNYDAQSSDNLKNHLFTAEPGYQFKDWKVTVADGYWTPLGKTYTNTNIPLSTKYGSATLTEEWSATSYNITYNANGGRVNGKTTQTDTYDIESTGTVRTATRSGHTFSGWKVTSVEEEGNWVLDQIIPSGTLLTGKYGKVTLTAQWDISFADIIIEISGLLEGDSAIFTVAKNNQPYCNVALTGNSSGTPVSTTLKNQETGVSYSVYPTSWSWTYTGDGPGGAWAIHAFNLGNSGYTCSFTAVPQTARNHDEKSAVNFK